ncbi:MAG TPA: flavodoxin [Candidatus Copromonas faecavium]|uniref:Flavodoxin n=1 Tax=Candidatus Copromonas faecavium (nom. illeg.) TaxID=2840740 RepID=A0A9D1A3X3_9FIRM|nr:flavodoxin [Candidatus Copromonas faecavium]
MNIKKFGKQTICLLSAGVLAVSLSACGDAAADQDSVSETERAAEQVSTVAAESGAGQVGTSGAEQAGASVTENPASEGDSHILIAYFTAAENSGVDAVSSASYSMINGEAVGRVQAVANMIQEYTGGDLFSIQTSVVYPADGGELIDYAATEQEEDARPELTTHIENLDQYDTIFVGYPSWWADLPMAMYSFFDEYDFSGKTIVPFNVHNGSRFSRTIQTIEELEPDASVIENGFTVSEQTVADADSDVAAWLEEIGY